MYPDQSAVAVPPALDKYLVLASLLTHAFHDTPKLTISQVQVTLVSQDERCETTGSRASGADNHATLQPQTTLPRAANTAMSSIQPNSSSM